MRITRNFIANDKLKSCACGCGKLISKIDKYGSERFFINGHQQKGKAFSEEHKRKIGLKNRGKKPNWKCGKYKTSLGYILVYNKSHKFSNNDGYVYEHRLVWEEYNKASLLSWGIVHHKNDIRDDNRIENLEGMSRKQHNKIHHTKLSNQSLFS